MTPQYRAAAYVFNEKGQALKTSCPVHANVAFAAVAMTGVLARVLLTRKFTLTLPLKPQEAKT